MSRFSDIPLTPMVNGDDKKDEDEEKDGDDENDDDNNKNEKPDEDDDDVVDDIEDGVEDDVIENLQLSEGTNIKMKTPLRKSLSTPPDNEKSYATEAGGQTPSISSTISPRAAKSASKSFAAASSPAATAAASTLKSPASRRRSSQKFDASYVQVKMFCMACCK